MIDQLVGVKDERAIECAKLLATQEGILVGISAGATLAGALELCQGLPAGSNVLCMLPDTGERYLSTPLFADIGAEMSSEELEISLSTPGYNL